MKDKFDNDYELLEEDIKNEERKNSLDAVSKKMQRDNINEFKKSVKAPKKLKTKVLAFALGAVAVVGAVAGIVAYTNSPEYKEKQYQKQVIAAEQKVEETIVNDVILGKGDNTSVIKNYKLQMMTFDDVKDENSKVHIYGHYYDTEVERNINSETIYTLAERYYNQLVEAENEGALKYFEVLNTCMEKLEFVERIYSNYNFDYKFNNEEAKKFNNLLASGDKTYLGAQVATLPFFIEDDSVITDKVNKIYTRSYNVKIISIYEVDKNGDLIELDGKQFILTNSLNSEKQYKIFEKTVTITHSWDYKNMTTEERNEVGLSNTFEKVLTEIKKGNLENTTCETKSIKEINLATAKYLEQEKGLNIVE